MDVSMGCRASIYTKMIEAQSRLIRMNGIPMQDRFHLDDLNPTAPLKNVITSELLDTKSHTMYSEMPSVAFFSSSFVIYVSF